MTRAACTIVSLNYLSHARTLCDSFLEQHPELPFYVLIVDRPSPDLDLSRERFRPIWVEDLGIPDFPSVAFKFDILELNTNVKPTFLKHLLAGGIDELIYFDPDILICSSLSFIFDLLRSSSIVVTPHALSPNNAVPAGEAILLYSGVFNLGFIAVANNEESLRFLSWWEDRCLTEGFVERRSGLFVDQKWINLVPCYYDQVTILKHPGCNVAYWNLHERSVAKDGQRWTVNGTAPLVFYHFSGVSVDGGALISKGYDQFTLESLPELAELFEFYRAQLLKNGNRELGKFQYSFARYDNGQFINKLQRALYAAHFQVFQGAGNPFQTSNQFYRWVEKQHLLGVQESAAQYNRQTMDAFDPKVRLVNSFLRLVLRFGGVDRYTVLMKYFGFISVLRNQKEIFPASR
jgi:hypothetical protein